MSEALDNVPLYHLFEDDQTDHLAVVEGSKTIAQIRDSEQSRIQQAVEMVRGDKLKTGRDFFRAAAIVQRSSSSENILLAHDLSLTAIAYGEKQATAIAASTEDRFLLAQGLKQRYGTQYVNSGNRVDLAPIDGSVTDTMRTQLGVPALKEAKENRAAFTPAS